MKFKLQIWDTASQEKFGTISKTYYKAASGILVTCDMSQQDSLSSIEKWMEQIKQNAPEACIIIVGTKNDLDPKISLDALKNFANEKKVPFVSTSAKTGNGVNEAFAILIKEVALELERKSINKEEFTCRLYKERKKEKSCC